MQTFVRTFLSAAFAASALTFAANAQSNITGNWTFETGQYNRGQCTITGFMTIWPDEEANRYTCSFTTFEDCGVVSAEVEQSCVARVEGDQAAFVSKIVKFHRQEPGPYGYAPDDWLLTIHSSDEMVGTLESATNANVIFRRQSAPVS